MSSALTAVCLGPDRWGLRRAFRLAWLTGAALLSAMALLPTAPALASPVPGTVQTFTYGSGLTAHPYLVYTPASYQLPYGPSRGVLQVRHGVIEEIGRVRLPCGAVAAIP